MDWPAIGLRKGVLGNSPSESSKRTLLPVWGRWGLRQRGVVLNKFEKGVHGRPGDLSKRNTCDPLEDLREPGRRRRAKDAAYLNSSTNTLKMVFASFLVKCARRMSVMGCLKTCL